MKDCRTELYDTLIDGVIITFEVHWVGGNWEDNEPGYWKAWGDDRTTSGDSAESAALNLVKLLEK